MRKRNKRDKLADNPGIKTRLTDIDKLGPDLLAIPAFLRRDNSPVLTYRRVDDLQENKRVDDLQENKRVDDLQSSKLN